MRTKILLPVSFLAGAAGGLAAGILWAPHKGSLTRAKLRNRLEAGKEEAEEKALRLSRRGGEMKKQAMENLKSMARGTKDQMDQEEG